MLSGVLGSTAANASFFAGSLFFTTAAAFQLTLSGRPVVASEPGQPRTRPGAGRRSRVSPAWLSAAVQLLGTVLFNISTLGALLAHTVTGERRLVWAPDVAGSIAFLVSSALAVVVLAVAGTLRRPRDAGWWATWLNLAGSVAFGISAVAAAVAPDGVLLDASLATRTTFLGAIGFLLAAAVLLPGAHDPDPPRPRARAYR